MIVVLDQLSVGRTPLCGKEEWEGNQFDLSSSLFPLHSHPVDRLETSSPPTGQG